MTNIFIRDFSEDVHRRAKIQAAKEGITLKDLIKKALIEYLEKKGG
ncbi:MAG: toxin-antitoxin system HicB family antitoxin [Desulfobacteraceae bacterium]|nr:MAG: toxin-antitoxin system HicB family antitoxin [Desulfobacteraceae bacterium]